tara:strand:+ start:7942 stop:8364 length:423 start_codon:yes stop_codon:yes gene_type:complete
MASNAIPFEGVTLGRSDGAGEFTTIAEITDLSGPGGQASVIDVSHVGSTYVDKMMGLADEGQVTMTCNLVPGDAAQQGLREDRTAKTKQSFKITLTDDAATELTFEAFVLGFTISGSVNDRVTAEVTLEVTGQVVWSDAA